MSQENTGAHIVSQYGILANFTSTTTSPYCNPDQSPIVNYVLTVSAKLSSEELKENQLDLHLRMEL